MDRQRVFSQHVSWESQHHTLLKNKYIIDRLAKAKGPERNCKVCVRDCRCFKMESCLQKRPV